MSYVLCFGLLASLVIYLYLPVIWLFRSEKNGNPTIDQETIFAYLTKTSLSIVAMITILGAVSIFASKINGENTSSSPVRTQVEESKDKPLGQCQFVVISPSGNAFPACQCRELPKQSDQVKDTVPSPGGMDSK